MKSALLEVNNLKKYFKTKAGILHAVDDVSFRLERGKTLGLVGESGCGKSTTGRLLLRLLEPTGGRVVYEDKDVFALDARGMRELRKEMQIIFQDPFSSLDPRKTVGETIEEPMRINGIHGGKKERLAKVMELMDLVGLARRLSNTYPHELDGGRLQRVGIARALSLNTKFVVCDEPVSALDVSIRAQILNLMEELQERLGLTYLFITHDLAVVNHFSDDIAVMYLGKIVEQATADELFENPVHPYTEALLSAIPQPSLDAKVDRILLKGELSSPIDPKPGCRFAGRCPYARDLCLEKEPPLADVGGGHLVACHLFTSSRRTHP
ncbi:MAG TPA: oligopeptide/dipeptide ABC transporter ATP-binding protein [Rectinemataceae bacterium]|nr:oligopeptide/dipeptide ABC transporter ATP-binding protein [Rectinemataceae bacterium]